jgi:glycosyltransferase involved in cell wall biosynthesis
MSCDTVKGLVSVVVASYNHARYLQRRMDSLFGQTYPDIEILVIDDCSPDDSVAVLQAYARHPRVQLIMRASNGGWVTVSNQGIEQSRGEYVLFANCDDDCEPQMIERLVAALAEQPAIGLAFCRSVMIDEDSTPIGDDFSVREPAFRARCERDCILTREEMRRFLMHSCVIPNLSAALIRRSCFDRVGVLSHDYRACSDWDLFFRIADHFDFAYIAAPLNLFRQHGRTIRSATKGRITYDEFFRVLLSQMGHTGFSAAERRGFRLHTMYLWAIELLRPSTSGWLNLPHHVRLIAALDARSLLYILPALMWRVIVLPVKAFGRLAETGRKSMLDLREWPLFVAQLRTHPWRLPGYGLELLALVGRRVAQRLRLRAHGRHPHRGLKRRPAWLTPARSTPDPKTGLRLPSLAIAGAMPVLTLPDLREDDPEAYFARHRWSACVAALGDEARARAAFKGVLDWMAQPPAYADMAWESYSCCERIVNLAILLAVHPSLLKRENEDQLCRFFDASAAWVDAHLEYYGPARTNNHFLNNGRALVVAGCLRGNHTWLRTGWAILEHIAPVLFSKDGCLREGSSHYQLIVSGWLFDAIAFAQRASSSDIPSGIETLARSAGRACARFALALPHMNQHIGDISPDLHPGLTLARLRLLHGERLIEAAPGPAVGNWLFTQLGQSVLLAHAERTWPIPYATHAHADLGSFIWMHAGRAILADAGRQDYLSRAETRAQLASSAHNTLTVNGMGGFADSVLSAGLWYPTPYAGARVEVKALEDGFTLRHDGFSRIPGVKWYRREVRVGTDGIEVVDIIEGVGRAALSIFWHFASDWIDDGETALISPARRVTVNVAGPAEPRRVWSDFTFSRAYGEAERARCVEFAWQTELPCRIHTRMRLETCAA